MDTYDINWDVRPEYEPIEYEGNTCEVCVGCEVSLWHHGEEIIVRVVQCTPGQPTVGEVIDFPAHDVDHVGELTIGSTVSFWDRHVFACAA
ncbi:MAG: hypothetical protein ACYSWT_12325 [Planctomycetota bacterium]|jgi:hypothetical protein